MRGRVAGRGEPRADSHAGGRAPICVRMAAERRRAKSLQNDCSRAPTRSAGKRPLARLFWPRLAREKQNSLGATKSLTPSEAQSNHVDSNPIGATDFCESRTRWIRKSALLLLPLDVVAAFWRCRANELARLLDRPERIACTSVRWPRIERSSGRRRRRRRLEARTREHRRQKQERA